MRVDRLTTPAAWLTLAEAKAHVRVDITDDDTYITSLITAATDRAETYLVRALMPRDLALVLDAFPADIIDVPRPPFISLTHIKYTDTAGTLQTLASSSYTVSIPSGPQASRARIAPVTTWPTTKGAMDAVTVTFRAGYTDAASVPMPIKQGVLMVLAALYEHRGDDPERADLTAAYHLLDPFKVYR